MMLLVETVIGSRTADAADRSALLEDRERVWQAIATIVRACLITLMEKKGYRKSELLRLAQTVESTLPEIVPLLRPEVQQELRALLERVLEQESDPALKQALQHLAAALDKSNKSSRSDHQPR